MDPGTLMRPAISIALVASMAGGLAGCRVRPPGEESEVVPQVVLEGVRFAVERGGATRATGSAGRIAYRRDSTGVTATGVEATLSGPGGPIRLRAATAEGVVSQRQAILTGGVEAAEGRQVARTATARFEPTPDGAGRVTGDDPVEVTGPGLTLHGRGFTLDPRRQELTVGRATLTAAGAR
jgi:hypothetical protein